MNNNEHILLSDLEKSIRKVLLLSLIFPSLPSSLLTLYNPLLPIHTLSWSGCFLESFFFLEVMREEDWNCPEFNSGTIPSDFSHYIKSIRTKLKVSKSEELEHKSLSLLLHTPSFLCIFVYLLLHTFILLPSIIIIFIITILLQYVSFSSLLVISHTFVSLESRFFSRCKILFSPQIHVLLHL